jgi:hypothetical protein
MDLNESSNRYIPLFNAFSTQTLTEAEQVMPVSGTVSQFHVRISGSPSSGDSYTFTVLKNGSPVTVASVVQLRCVISDAATTCSSTTGSIQYSAGDRIAIEADPNSDPDVRRMRWTAKFAAD